MASTECVTSEDCFYNGKRFKKGDKVSFFGNKKDLPKHLVEIKQEKKVK